MKQAGFHGKYEFAFFRGSGYVWIPPVEVGS